MVKPKDTDSGRFYPWKKEQYVSVTTVIGEGVPKPGLNKWKVKKMAEVAADTRHQLSEMTKIEAKDFLLSYDIYGGHDAAGLGTRVHALCEKEAQGKAVLPSAQEKPFLDNFRQFMVDWGPVYEETESTVFSREHGYAGTLDAIATIDGKRYVIDIKTGKSVWPEAALQMSAYRFADFIGRAGNKEDALPEIDGGLVLHIRPDYYHIITVDTSEQVFDTFLSALDVFRWNRVDGREAIGAVWTKES